MTTPTLVLSLFPGIGLLDAAFEETGFCVVRGPDKLWGGEIKTFHVPAGVFDGVIGGPPCQAFSRLRHLVEANGYQVAENLIPEFERLVAEAQPRWFLMENVPAAPRPEVTGYLVCDYLLNNRWVGGEQHRLRRFSFGTTNGLGLRLDVVLLEAIGWAPAVLANGGTRAVLVALGGSGKPKTTLARDLGRVSRDYYRRACRLQGLPEDFLADAPFTIAGKCQAIGNGVPLLMGRAIARAVKQAVATETADGRPV